MSALTFARTALGVALLASGAAGASPRVDYMLNCMGCHLVDGSGAPGKVPSFKEHLGGLLRAPGGREFLVQVPGSAHSPLSDERLAAVLNWIVANFAGAETAGFSPYTAVEVADYRQRPLLNVPARREALLRSASGQSGSNPTVHSAHPDFEGVTP